MWLFVSVVAMAYGVTLALRPEALLSRRTFILVVLGIIYTFAGTYGERWCGAKETRRAMVGYFSFQIILSAFIIFLSWEYHGLIQLIIVPLVSQALIVFSWRGVAIVIGATLFSLVVSHLLLVTWQAAMESSLSMLTAMVAVALITHIATREYQTRLEVERLAAELEQANGKLREYAVQAEELATTQERNRLAREIHDSLGHYLTVINIQLEAARAVLGRDPALGLAAIEKAQTLTKNGLTEVRRSVATLRVSPVDDLSLPEAIQPLLEECRSGGLSAALTICGSPIDLDRRTKLTLYRVAQEGLTNVQRHAQAERVDITLNYADPGQVCLCVEDDGRGTEQQSIPNHFGLLGIRERVKLLKGEVQTESKPGQGFILRVQVPFCEKGHRNEAGFSEKE